MHSLDDINKQVNTHFRINILTLPSIIGSGAGFHGLSWSCGRRGSQQKMKFQLKIPLVFELQMMCSNVEEEIKSTFGAVAVFRSRAIGSKCNSFVQSWIHNIKHFSLPNNGGSQLIYN
jgi:hypothetical protein